MSELQHQRIVELCQELRLSAVPNLYSGVAQSAARKEASFADFLEETLRAERDARSARAREMFARVAGFPAIKTLDGFDFAFAPGAPRSQIHELASLAFIERAENVVFLGPSGVGKTHLAIALGRAAVEAGHSVLFVTATSLLAQLSRAQLEGKLADQIAFYAKPKLLVVDELGYLPLEKQTAHLFFQLVSRRYERGSMLITTNQTITQWGHVFGDEMIAAAVLDRVLHHSHVLVIQGDSFRLRQKKRAGLLGSSKANN
jgi:DNA replication protein DnaC